jgi:hypothetical protein
MYVYTNLNFRQGYNWWKVGIVGAIISRIAGLSVPTSGCSIIIVLKFNHFSVVGWNWADNFALSLLCCFRIPCKNNAHLGRATFFRALEKF